MYRYRLTRLGFHFLFVALFAIVGGSLRGFNLLLLLAGLLIAVLIIQWRQGRSAIRRTRCRRQPVTGTFAGKPLALRYEVRNTGRWLPLWNIQIEDLLAAESIAWEPSDDETNPFDPPIPLIGSIGNIPGGQTRGTSILCRFARRGVYKLGPAVASTHFPFCLMTCQRLSKKSLERIYVYPRPIRLGRGWRKMLPSRHAGDVARSSRGTRHEGEFFGLRPWRSGDHVKHVHWRTTARIGEPAVRQFEQRTRHKICLVVDGTTARSTDRQAFETVLRLTTTLLVELCHQTASVALLVIDRTPDAADQRPQLLQSSGTQMEPLLKRLATATAFSLDRRQDQTGRSGSIEGLDPLAEGLERGESQLLAYDLVVVSARPFREFQRAVKRQREVGAASASRAGSILQRCSRNGRLTWIDVQSAAVLRHLELDDPTGEPNPAPFAAARGGLIDDLV